MELSLTELWETNLYYLKYRDRHRRKECMYNELNKQIIHQAVQCVPKYIIQVSWEEDL